MSNILLNFNILIISVLPKGTCPRPFPSRIQASSSSVPNLIGQVPALNRTREAWGSLLLCLCENVALAADNFDFSFFFLWGQKAGKVCRHQPRINADHLALSPKIP